jgi:hypothetical protein
MLIYGLPFVTVFSIPTVDISVFYNLVVLVVRRGIEPLLQG